MASRLYWRFGFGWGAVLLAAILVAVAVSSRGFLRVVAILLAVGPMFYIVERFRSCYLSPWGRFHHRGMLAHAMILGTEHAAAQRDGRTPDAATVYSRLMESLCYGEAPNTRPDMTQLAELKGEYLGGLLGQFPDALPQNSPAANELPAIIEKLREQPLSEVVVIAKAIEHHFDRRQAALYVAAVITGKVR